MEPYVRAQRPAGEGRSAEAPHRGGRAEGQRQARSLAAARGWRSPEGRRLGRAAGQAGAPAGTCGYRTRKPTRWRSSSRTRTSALVTACPGSWKKWPAFSPAFRRPSYRTANRMATPWRLISSRGAVTRGVGSQGLKFAPRVVRSAAGKISYLDVDLGEEFFPGIRFGR
jgi:hypothetical protein